MPGERVLDATDCVVYPGWVNTHHHLFQSLLKGVPAGIDATLTPWLKAVPYAHRGGFDEATLRLAARIGLVELMLSGCTTVADHHYIYYPGMGFDPSAALFDEAEKLGVRFMLLRGGATQTRDAEAGAPAHLRPETLDAMLGAVEATARRFHQRGPRAMHPRRDGADDRDDLAEDRRGEGGRAGGARDRRAAALAPVRDGQLHRALPRRVRHAAARVRGRARVARARRLVRPPRPPRADPRCSCSPTPAPASRTARRATAGSAAASRRRRRWRGSACAVSLGVDGAASNEAADMLSEAHQCWLMHRAHAGAASRARPEGAGEAGADAVTVEQIVHWGSAGGARVLGFDGVGTLAVGQAADLAVYALDEPRYFGLHDPAIGPVVSGGRPTLKWLVADGSVVVEDDAIPGLDMAELRAQSRVAVERLMRAA